MSNAVLQVLFPDNIGLADNLPSNNIKLSYRTDMIDTQILV